MLKNFLFGLLIASLVFGPVLSDHYIYGTNDTLEFSYAGFDIAAYVNGSPICTPANGLCNSSGAGVGGGGYNISDGTWIYNGSSGLTFNTTTGNATYQRIVTPDCDYTANYFLYGVYSNGTSKCYQMEDSDTTYSASGTLLGLSGTTFSLKEGILTNGSLCTFNASDSKLYCNTSLPTSTNYYDNITSLQTNLGSAVDNLSSEITNRQNNDTGLYNNISKLQSENSSIYSAISSVNSTVNGIYSNVSTIQSTTSGLYTNVSNLQSTSNSYYSNISSLQNSNSTTNSRIDSVNTTATRADGYYSNASSYPAVQSALYTNISMAQGYYTNSSQGATAYSHMTDYYANSSMYPGLQSSLYTNISQGQTAYSNMNQYYTNASQGATAYTFYSNASLYPSLQSLLYTNITQAQGYYTNSSNGQTAYSNMNQYYTNSSKWNDYQTNKTLILSSNTTWPVSTFTGASAANVNITTKNLTVNCILFDSGGSICSLS